MEKTRFGKNALTGLMLLLLCLLLAFALRPAAYAEEPPVTWAVTFYDNGGMHDVGPEAGEVKVYSEANYPGVSIRAVAQDGGEYADDDHDGVLLLPDGVYEFYIDCRHNHVIGDVTVAGAPASVSVGMWDFADWLDVNGVRIALESVGASFYTYEIPVEVGDHLFRVDAPDIHAGSIAVYAGFNPAVFTEEELEAKDPWMMRNVYSAVTQEYRFVGRVNTHNDRNVRVRCMEPNSIYGGITIFDNGDRIEANCAKGVSGPLWVFLQGDLPGYFRYQDYTFQVDRIPTLSDLKATDVNGSALTAVNSFNVEESNMVYDYEYRTPASLRQVVITPTPVNAAYEVTVNGQPLTDGSFTLDLEQEGGSIVTTVATVTVRSGAYSRDYTVTFTPMEEKILTFNTTQPGTTVQVFNKDGDEIFPAQSRQVNGLWSYLYKLTGGETYTWLATKDEYFHSTKTFTMEESANTTIAVSVIDDEDWLDGLTFPGNVWGNTGLPSSWLVEPVEFSPEQHAYEPLKYDWDGELSYIPVFDDTKYVFSQRYVSIRNELRISTNLISGQRYAATNWFITGGAKGAQMTLRLAWTGDDGVTYYQEYILNVKRVCTLKDLSVSCDGTALALNKPYERGDLALTTKAPYDGRTLSVYAPHGVNYEGNYSIRVNGVLTDENDVAVVPLSGTAETETVTIEVNSADYPEASRTIVLTVLKTQPVSTAVTYAPAEAVLTFRNDETGERLWPDAEGRWTLHDSYSYTYTLTAPGYVGRRNTVQVTADAEGAYLILDGDAAHPVAAGVEAADGGQRFAAALSLSLSPAPENTRLDHTMEAEWADFRGTSYTYDAASGRLVAGGSAYTNNGVVSAPTPISAGDSALYWANEIGKGWAANAVSSPILVDGDLVVYAGDRLFRVDPVNGEIKAQGQMASASAFSINPPFYYDGMIFVALANGKIQAFDAATLESLWIYTDPEGGQPNSQITIYNGYLYTGFWNNEDLYANFVCLTVTDEDPSRGSEPKYATWTHLQLGGFYWAGAYVCDDFLLVGTDDGVKGIVHSGDSGPVYNESSELLLLDPRTGAVLDRRSGLKCDIRCGVTYDAVTDAYYFVSKGGLFYQAKVTREDGEWRISALRSLALDNYDIVLTGPPMSTSTPVVYNGRAYIGVSGQGQFNAYSGHNLTVIDLENWCIAYHVRTEGYPQTSGLLTTAYEDTGCVYVYFIDNMQPGKLRMLRDRPGQTAPDPITVESYTQYGTTTTYETPYVLFTPVGEQAQFAICSPICDEYGVMYFKNDSGYLMAFGPSVESLEVTAPPRRTSYRVGETFNPSGMVVTLTYSNGLSRDVTDYVTWSEEPLEEGETEFTLSFLTLYHNADADDGTSQEGVRSNTVFTTLAITVSNGTEGFVELTDGGTETVAYGVYAPDGGAADLTTAIMAAKLDGIGEVRAFLGQTELRFNAAAIAQLSQLDEIVAGLRDVTAETQHAIRDAAYYRLEVNGAQLELSSGASVSVTIPFAGATENTRAYGLKANGTFGKLTPSCTAETLSFTSDGKSGNKSASYTLYVVKTVLPGDVTGDGKITSTDAAKTLRFAAGVGVEGYDFLSGDITYDGAVKAADATMILRRSVGL